MNQIKYAYLSMVILGQILLLSWNNLLAQVETIRAGERIWLKLHNKKSIIGKFKDIQNDTLFIDDIGTVKGIPFSNIKKLMVARWKARHLLKGAAIGGGIGEILGMIKFYEQRRSDDLEALEEAFAAIGYLSILPAYGVIAGALIGGIIPSTNWVVVTLPDASSKKSATDVESRGIATQATAKIPQSLITPKHRWRCTINSGNAFSEINMDIENAIIQSGFDNSDILEETGDKIYRYYPRDNTDPLKIGMPLSLQVDYLLKPYLYSSLLMLHSTLATVSGHQSNPEIFISLKARSMALCSLLILRPNNGTPEFGIGPGLFYNQIEQRQIGEVSSRRQKITLGMVGHIAASFPARTRLFIYLGLQYRWTPKTTFGPFKMWSAQSSSVLDRFTTDFTHVFWSAGLGYYF